MPIRNDTTAYTGAAELEAVGGRRLVRLENGWLVEGHITAPSASNSALYVKYSKDDGATWLSWAAKGNAYMDALAIASKGNVVYSIASWNKSHFQLRYWDFDKEAQGEAAAYSGFTDIDTGFSSTTGKCALHIEGNKIYAAYSGVKSPTTSSNNVFIREGTIQADNSVVWKDAEKWTAYNSANDSLQRPSIAFDGEKLVVFAEYIGSGYNSVIAMARTGMANGPTATILVRYTTISGGSYQTRAGQGIYVPRNINGLMNGRLWYAFWGYDATDTSYANLRCAYSDDRGATWTVEKLTSGNVLSQEFPTITATSRNQIIIVWQGEANVNHDIRMIKRSGNVWGAIYNIKSSTSVVSFSPHTIFDLSLDYRIPPLIYRDSTNALIGFYADFDSINISPKQGFIGSKSDRTNIHAYTLNSVDALPSNAREYIDGIRVNTKNPAAGVQETASAPASVWDKLRFSKYGDRKNIVPQNIKFWRQGGIDAAMFAPAFPIASTTTRIRTPDALPVTGGKTYEVSVGVGYSMLIAEYDFSYNLITYFDWYVEGTHSRTMHADTRYIVVCLRYYDNSTIYPSVAPLAEPAVYETKVHEHELRIENGDFVFSYTFDKRVPTNADVLTATKAVKDSQEVFIPKIKTNLVTAVNAKGASAIDGETFEEIIAALEGTKTFRVAKGTVTSSGTTKTFEYVNNSTTSFYFLEIPFSSIGFVPKILVASVYNSFEYKHYYEEQESGSLYPKTMKLAGFSNANSAPTIYNMKGDKAGAYVNDTGVCMPVIGGASTVYNWIAYG